MTINEYSSIYNDVAKKLLGEYAKSQKNKNIVLSPMSIIMLLGIAADAVSGKTRDEITEIIGKEISFDELKSVLSQIQSSFAESGSLMSSNAVCVKESIAKSIAAGYADRLKEIFDGRLFSSNDIVRDVNAWVAEKTKGMIENAADESMNQTLACLMNAIAFESEWEDPYLDEDISKGKFHNADGSESAVQMMRSTEYSFVEDSRFTGFIKPYKDQKYAFMALLPRSKSKSFLLNAVDQIDFSKLAGSAYFCEVHASMPEFKYDFGEDLTELCKELGIRTLFSPEADFSPMSSEWLKVDSIIHKAHIEVDRLGTKAAAVTMAYVVAGCAPTREFKRVNLNRPFVYAIMNTETGLPVFTGVFNSAADSTEVKDSDKITAKTREEFISGVVKDCLANLTEDEKDYLVNNPAYMHHFGYGMYIRNHYILNKDFSEAGFYDHPDDLSGDIIDQIISHIRAERWTTTTEEEEKHVR
jgi:serpin B